MFEFCNMHVQKFEHACSNFEQHAKIATMLTWDFFQNLMFRVKSHVQSGTCMFHMSEHGKISCQHAAPFPDGIYQTHDNQSVFNSNS
jgi:hypothetical protein